MTPRRLTRLALGYLTLVSLQIGLWALLGPRSFYDDFPGLGRSWVAVDGPFNEHLVRDVGGLNLALAALLVAAAWRLSRDLVAVAAVASLAWGIPHLLYHVFNTSELSTDDNIISLAGLAVFVAFAVVLLITARGLERPSRPDQGRA